MKAEVEAAEETVNDIWVTLSADVARSYIELRGGQIQALLIDRQIQLQQDVVEIIQEQVSQGLATMISQKEAEERLFQIEAKKPQIELTVLQAIHRLSILIAKPPAELFSELTYSCQALPRLPVTKPIGIPSELLRRRPDIRKAERGVAAATERVGSAIAAMFPRFSLKGFLGDVSTHLPSLLSQSGATWIAGPQLLLPIFNSRLIEQDIQFNKLAVEQSLFAYQKTVLSALEETENAIATFHCELKLNQLQVSCLASSRDAYQLALDLYQVGLQDYFESLRLEASQLTNEEKLLQSDINLLIHYIALYKSLGGGWNCCLETDP